MQAVESPVELQVDEAQEEVSAEPEQAVERYAATRARAAGMSGRRGSISERSLIIQARQEGIAWRRSCEQG